MSENKKYFYIKLKENFFDTPEIQILQNLPKGYIYSDILLKLYLKTLNNAGKLVFRGNIELTVKMVSSIVRYPVKIVEKAFEKFERLGLLTTSGDGTKQFIDVENFIGESSVEADKKRLYRNKRKYELKEKNNRNLKNFEIQNSDSIWTNGGQNLDNTRTNVHHDVRQMSNIDIVKDIVRDTVIDKDRGKEDITNVLR